MTVIVMLLLMFVLNGEAQSKTLHAIGAGANASCKAWLSERELKDYFDLANWGLGYLSGVSELSGEHDAIRGIDNHRILYWLDGYCRANPRRLFVDGLDSFIAAHPG